ncbi:response regulator transcription factor [bacterium]|nr:response regulator transcription factor [bacterium]
MSNEPIRIVIIDDTRIRMECLVRCLKNVKDFVVAGTAATHQEAIELVKEVHPHTALIEGSIAGNGAFVLAKALHQMVPDVRLIILGLDDNIERILSFIESGISGYTLKDSTTEYLITMIHAVQRDEAMCSPRVIASLFSRLADLKNKMPLYLQSAPIDLTKREAEIASLVAQGLPNKEIAQRLFIETQTVKNHIHNILEKLHLQNRYEILKYMQEYETVTSN